MGNIELRGIYLEFYNWLIERRLLSISIVIAVFSFGTLIDIETKNYLFIYSIFLFSGIFVQDIEVDTSFFLDKSELFEFDKAYFYSMFHTFKWMSFLVTSLIVSKWKLSLDLLIAVAYGGLHLATWIPLYFVPNGGIQSKKQAWTLMAAELFVFSFTILIGQNLVSKFSGLTWFGPILSKPLELFGLS
ncbi:hypothetical protein LJ739_11265 [Aestuariibacter halophilus]|uniref:Uncharacterized protein n=2 Tax=Fluctibacter halophilus TaxID=226011 RepID=A0ABS8G9M3_9ALTE|nr:hypothetical protein [Aestuariibacter halophilus]